ncbi:MAG: hypothetical protein OES47_03215 [Acidobacteriota bacterium]|nr:hypothetical protein [Acidobacteriota bacterium]
MSREKAEAFGGVSMMRMLCRNRVMDYEKWWAIFSSHTTAHRDAGLELEHVWRDIDDPANVFFVFAVHDIDRARAFIDAPAAEEAGEESGVLEGEYHFVEGAAT